MSRVALKCHPRGLLSLSHIQPWGDCKGTNPQREPALEFGGEKDGRGKCFTKKLRSSPKLLLCEECEEWLTHPKPPFSPVITIFGVSVD